MAEGAYSSRRSLGFGATADSIAALYRVRSFVSRAEMDANVDAAFQVPRTDRCLSASHVSATQRTGDIRPVYLLSFSSPFSSLLSLYSLFFSSANSLTSSLGLTLSSAYYHALGSETSPWSFGKPPQHSLSMSRKTHKEADKELRRRISLWAIVVPSKGRSIQHRCAD